MIIVLDSNEFIDFLNDKTEDITKVLGNNTLLIYINDMIIREVLRNIPEIKKREFYNLIFTYNLNYYGYKLPAGLMEKYKKLGYKKGDVTVAALCETTKAEYLVSENRHFLKELKSDKFKVINLKDFINLLK